MSIQIRQGVFETNSSSTHSVTISTDNSDLLDRIPLDDSGKLSLGEGEFGWEVKTYNDALSKANYIAIYIRDWSGENKDEFWKIFKDVMESQTGCEVLIKTEEESDWSYIDHQSVEGGRLDHLFRDPEILRQFVFNPSSKLETDNDNY